MACLECGLEEAVADAGTCPRCAAPVPAAADVSETFTDWGCAGLRVDSRGITSRFERRLISWEEIGWFRDGLHDGRWMLHIVLANGDVTPVREIRARGKRPVPPELLAAIRSTAAAHSIPAVLTGASVLADLPDKKPGLYADPAGEQGLREWTGTEWSPFLQVDPVASGQPGQQAELARIWSPLSAAELRRQSRAIMRDVWLSNVATALFVVVMPLFLVVASAIEALHHDGSSSPQDVAASGVFCVLGLACWGLVVWFLARPAMKIARALTAAAIQAAAEDDPPSRPAAKRK